MARGRLGGTRSLIRGAVGTNVFSIGRDESGDLTQVVSTRVQERRYSNTDLQIRNRMIMGQIERMFHVLPSIISGGFIKVDRGEMSFQRFSSLNYRRLREDFDNNYSGVPRFDWRDKRDMTAPAGEWILTDGSLTPPVFSSVTASSDERNGVEFVVDGVDSSTRVRDILIRMNVCPGDSLVLFLFRKNAPKLVPFIQQFIFKVSIDVDPDLPISQTYENDVIVPANDSVAQSAFDMARGQFFIRWEDANAKQPYFVQCFGMMVVRQIAGAAAFSDCVFRWADDGNVNRYPRHNPSAVFPSWKQA